MNKKPCKYEALLSALTDGELTAQRSAEVRGHLASCEGCRRGFEALQGADAMVQGMAGIEPSADFDRTFWRKVDRLEKQESRRSGFLFSIAGRWPVLAGGLMAALLVFILVHTHRGVRLTPEEVFIAQNMELLQDYDMIDQLDMLEQWDAIESLNGST